MIRSTRRLLLAATLFAVSLSPARASLPAGWTDADIGSPHNAGSASYNSSTGTFTVTGSGSEIYGMSDQFNYCYQQFTGNFTFIARITGNSGTDVNGGAADGIMLRESLSASSREEEIFVQPNGPHVFVQTRQTDGGSTVRYGQGTGTVYPTWMKMERDGDQVALYYSTDGVTYYAASSQTLFNLNATVYVGLTVTARNSAPDAINTVTYDTVSLSSLKLPVVTSWFGNSFPTDNHFVQLRGEALAVQSIQRRVVCQWIGRSGGDRVLRHHRQPDRHRLELPLQWQ